MKFTDRQKRPGKAHEGFDVLNAEDRARFEQLVLPHLDAAFNLAVWILSSRSDAEDVTQDAMLRAFRFFEGFMEATCALGCCKSSAILVTPGWRRIAE
jgi:hypothetical protein